MYFSSQPNSSYLNSSHLILSILNLTIMHITPGHTKIQFSNRKNDVEIHHLFTPPLPTYLLSPGTRPSIQILTISISIFRRRTRIPHPYFKTRRRTHTPKPTHACSNQFSRPIYSFIHRFIHSIEHISIHPCL